MEVQQRRRNSNSIDEDGNVLRHGVKLGELWKTDMQVAITERNRREDAFFTIKVRKNGIKEPYQQTIPMEFAKSYKNLLRKHLTVEGPTGQTWTTILKDSYSVVRFGRGWRQFSRENHLQEGYQLLFTLVGRFRFLVQFFDRLGKKCTSYPPLPSARPGALPVAGTQRESDLQPDPQSNVQQGVDGRQASHRHGRESHTSAAAPLMQTFPNSAIPVHSEHGNIAILRQYGPELPPQPSLPAHKHMRELEEHTFDAGEGWEALEMEDEEHDEEAQNDIFHDSDLDEATMQTLEKTERSIHAEIELSRGKKFKFHSPNKQAHSRIQDHNSPSSGDEHPFQDYSQLDEATMQTLEKTERSIHAEIELSRGKKFKLHSPNKRAHSQTQDHNNSSSTSDEHPFQDYSQLQKEPVRVTRPPPVATPVASHREAGGSSRSSRAMRELQRQGCMRFSQIVMKCERRDASDQERRVVVDAAKRFISKLADEMFMVVMRDKHVYHTFHLAIPEKFLEATGTERKSKVEVWLLDIEQAVYKTHWTRQNFCDKPLLEHDAWAKFAVDHSLEEGDVCVFQLLQSKPTVSIPALLFCVHIFGVVETPVGQLDFSDAIDNN